MTAGTIDKGTKAFPTTGGTQASNQAPLGRTDSSGGAIAKPTGNTPNTQSKG